MSPGGCPHLEELRGDQVERLVPTASLPARVGARLGPRATHREVHPIAMIVELGRGPALGADGPAVRMRSVRLDPQRARAGVRGRHHGTVHGAKSTIPLGGPARVHSRRSHPQCREYTDALAARTAETGGVRNRGAVEVLKARTSNEALAQAVAEVAFHLARMNRQGVSTRVLSLLGSFCWIEPQPLDVSLSLCRLFNDCV